MVSAGRVLIKPRGSWNSLTTYEMLDSVSYGGNMFVAKRQNANVTPVEGDDWMLSCEGATGVVVSSFNGRTGAVVPTSGDYNLTNMGDVNISTASDGQVLKYHNESGKWVNGNVSTTLAGLADTDVSSPTNKQGLIFNGTSNKWENADIEGLPSNVITYAQFIQMSDAEQLAFTGYVTDYPGIDDAPTASDTVFDNTGTDLVSNNVNDAIDEVNDKVDALYKLKYFDVTVTSGVSSYNYNNDKPSDFYAPISAMSIGGGTCVVSQIGSSTMYFTASLSSSSVVRILYKAL